MNIIDTLVLELGLDPSKLNTGQQAAMATLRHFEQEATTSGRRVESEVKRINNTLSDFRREAISALGFIFGGLGIKQFITDITTLDASTGRLAKTFGVSTQELSTWQGIFQQVGASADSANQAIGGINAELVRFQLTGQSSMLGVLNQMGVSMKDDAGKLKTATQLFFDITDAIEKRKMDPRFAAGLLGMIPGMNQDAINIILKGTAALREYERQSAAARGTTDASADAAERYQASMGRLERSITNVKRAFMDTFGDWMTEKIQAVATGIQSLSDTPADRKAREAADQKARGGTTYSDQVRSKFGAPPKWLTDALGRGIFGSMFRDDAAPAAPAAPLAAPTRGNPSKAEVEAYIRQAARSRGMDPDVAVRVAQSEGLNGGAKAIGDAGSSFGPFQLHYGGMAGGPNAGRGLGDDFTRRTGLHARDPSTWQKQVDFSLDSAKAGGWGPWHGWRGHPFAGIPRGPSVGATASAFAGPDNSSRSNSTTTTSIGQIVVNAPQAKDAEGIAREIGPAMERSITAAAANNGSQ